MTNVFSLLLACAAPPAPAEPLAPPPAEPPAEPAAWSLVGRASSAGLDTPSLPGGAAALGAGCAALNARLRGDGPPCFVEEWAAGDARVRVERAGTKLTFAGAPGRATWSPIAGALAGCLGDPLAVPPAGDPGATRALERGPDGDTWVLTLSGANPCALGGTLRLSATRDHADWHGVTVDGLPWDLGGREAAQDRLRAMLRDTVAHRWDTLGLDERDDALRALAQDPHPDAARLIALRR